jgi:hypothetical protein
MHHRLWWLLARTSSNCKLTRPLIKESASHRQTRNCLTVIKIWFWTSDGGLAPRQTSRLAVGRNITLSLVKPVSRKLAFSLFGPWYTHRYFPEDIAHADSFTGVVPTNYWRLYKIVINVWKKNWFCFLEPIKWASIWNYKIYIVASRGLFVTYRQGFGLAD